MAQVTQLHLTGVMGRVQTFAAKAAFALVPVAKFTLTGPERIVDLVGPGRDMTLYSPPRDVDKVGDA